jgi:N-acetylglucosaminyl-diphospho-decaprenol L-rhamnosyltransferase
VAALAVSYAGILGGAERVLLEVASRVEDPPLLACPPGPLAEEAGARGFGVFELRERSLELRRSPVERVKAAGHIAGQAAELRSLVATLRPAAVLTWGMRAALAACAAFPAGAGRPQLVFQHNDLLPGPLIGRAVRACALRSDLVVVPSACVALDLDHAGAIGSKLRVVRPGVDLERFRPQPATDGLEVLLLGAIERWKRPDIALDAVALAAGELPRLRLRVAGEPVGTEGQRLLADLRGRAEANALRGRVTFAGQVARSEDVLSEAACLLHCAEREPFGLVVAEALASGLPVVAPDSCGPGELLDRDCGRLYRPGDAAAASRALVEVLRDPDERTRMCAAARARAEQELDIAKVGAAYAGLFEELAGPSRPRRRPARSNGPRGARLYEARGADLAIVTVLHNSERELAILLASLERHLPGAQVVMVDSGSSDGGPELAGGWRGGHAELVSLGENAGFGRGVNEGLRRVRRPVTALLNPDIELLDASLAAAGREALGGPERLLAPLVLRPDGSREDNAQREPGSAPLLAHALVPGRILPGPLAEAVEPWRSRRPRRAGWPVASCLVVRTETLLRLGPFDERVFMYAEDLDLGLRAADTGVETWFWPAARVRHSGAHASGPAFGGEPFEVLARRRREVVRERRGPRRARRDDLLQLLTFADRLLLKRLAGRPAEREHRQLAALRHAKREDGR